MLSCAACAAPLPERASFCPACGGAAASGPSPASSLETAPARPGRQQISRGSGAPPGAGLAPGTVLAGRYRIAGLLGRGGMGEVYRAEDLVLGQDVALKFLSKELETDPDALERLLSEVRNARQISHPHVCRVHDVGQAGDRHFLTMEYVDGEDLSTLLHRIGRLPAKKAVEVARQICAGLSAVHEKGVVHRDLKPGNVMLDGHGRVRITDFGLAVAGSHAAGEIAGTPAYMAPEQLAGEPATPRTDLYALGLLLYEIFTGVRPFEAASFAEWREVHSRQLPAPPGSHVGDLDPAVERIVLRCLEKDPARRPSKASAVALALPGGDPLAAALAAGETPPPELVAASSAGAALRPGAAAAVFVAVVLALLGLSVGSRCNLFRRVPFEKPAEALADRASALIAESGYLVRATDSAWGFELDQSWLGATEDPMPAPARWGRIETGQPLTYGFWYRQSPVPLEPGSFGGNRGEISRLDPPARVSGMASVLLDPRGRLVELHVVPQETAPPAGSPAPAEPGWERLFAAAGLDLGRFTPVAPRWSPPGFADARAAWQGTYADHSDLPIRVEAASFLGRPVYFRVVAPWDQPPLAASDVGSGARAAGIVGLVLVLTVLLGAAVLARRNLRLGRGDLHGALRVAAFAALAASTAALLRSDLPLTPSGVAGRLLGAMNSALLTAGILWVCYVALEPFVRRHRPHLIVSWTRLLGGELRDPLVGRDLAGGILLGLAMAAVNYLGGWLKIWTSHPLAPNRYLVTVTLSGVRKTMAVVLDQATFSLFATFAVLVFLVLARRLVRQEWAGIALLWAALCSMEILFSVRSWPAVVATLLGRGLMVGVISRTGLLTGTVASFASGLAILLPLTADVSAPYAGAALTGVGVLLTLAAFGAWTSLGTTGIVAPEDDD